MSEWRWWLDNGLGSEPVGNIDSDEWREFYTAYLATEHWQERRQYMIAEYKRCQDCGIDTDLQVHHRSYTFLGQEPDCDLVVLCRRCHAERHGLG